VKQLLDRGFGRATATFVSSWWQSSSSNVWFVSNYPFVCESSVAISTKGKRGCCFAGTMGGAAVVTGG
jgi:hypothetical protein